MTYCDFKPGDEVVCVDAQMTPGCGYWAGLVDGRIYTVARTMASPSVPMQANVLLVGHPNRHRATGVDHGFRASRFRKVSRRDLSAWLETSTDFEEPKRSPAKESV